ITAQGQVDMVKLYNKVKFLKDVNTPVAQGGRPPQPQQPRVPADTTDQKPKRDMKVAKSVASFLMMTRSLNFNYQQNEGTLIPGYLPSARFFGLDQGFDAPGVPFVLGRQYDLDHLYDRVYSNGWYTDSSQYLNT